MNRIALITGASGGIGSAIAKKFAEAGYSVAMQYHSDRESAELVAESLPEETDYLCVSCDFRDSESIDAMIDTIHTRLGTVSVLINCAGVALVQKLFSDTTDDEYDFIFDTNVRGTLHLTRKLVDDLRLNRGSTVTVSSMWGISGASCEVLYSASKAALIGFTKSLAKELAPSDVTVNAVAPGLVPTEMNAHLSKEDLDAFCAETPLNRLGTPEDVADAVFFLSQARFITGQILCCDGGCTI